MQEFNLKKHIFVTKKVHFTHIFVTNFALFSHIFVTNLAKIDWSARIEPLIPHCKKSDYTFCVTHFV